MVNHDSFFVKSTDYLRLTALLEQKYGKAIANGIGNVHTHIAKWELPSTSITAMYIDIDDIDKELITPLTSKENIKKVKESEKHLQKCMMTINYEAHDATTKDKL